MSFADMVRHDFLHATGVEIDEVDRYVKDNLN